MANNRVTFGSKLGVVLATVGCAVGLGSIWRFPYMLGTNGASRICWEQTEVRPSYWSTYFS